MLPAIKIKRIYEDAAREDGFRVLADRLWPRGIARENAHIHYWAKELAPTAPLRKWFAHDPALWPEFKKKYLAELEKNSAVNEFINDCKDRKSITLLFAGKDEDHSHVVILQNYLKQKFDDR
jgi:uncharacterized protein YeaO (DUF488 family)